MADLIRGSSATLRELVFHTIEPLPPSVEDSLSLCTGLRELRIREGCLDQVCRCSLPSLETLSVTFAADGRCRVVADALGYADLVASILDRCAGLSRSLRTLRVQAAGSTGHEVVFHERCERLVSAFQRRRPHVRVGVV